jgi:hypothetical protein
MVNQTGEGMKTIKLLDTVSPEDKIKCAFCDRSVDLYHDKCNGDYFCHQCGLNKTLKIDEENYKKIIGKQE